MHARALIALVAVLVLVVAAVLVWEGGDEPEKLPLGPELVSASEARSERPADLKEPPREPATDGRTAAEAPPADTTPKPSEGARGLLFVCTFAGRFVDDEGRPLADVKLRCDAGFGEIFSRADTRAGADGQFALPLTLPARRRGRSIDLTASLAGFASRRLQPVANAGSAELGDVVLTRAGSISGRVIDEHGLGFPDATVAATGMATLIPGLHEDGPGDDALVESTSDDAGAFLLPDVPAGDVRVWAGAEGRRWAFSDDLRVRPGEELRDVELRVEPVPADDVITLIVVDPEGRPVPHASVRYLYTTEGLSGSGNDDADEEGRLRFVLPVRANYDFTAWDPDETYRPGTARAVAPGTVDRVIQLGEPRELTLVVRGPDGALDEFSGRVRTFHEDRGLSGQSARRQEHDPPGHAVLQLPVETFEVTVEADGYARVTLGRFDPELVGETLAVVLEPLPGVTGRVLDERGEPVPGARVSLHEAVGELAELEINGFPARSQRHGEATGISDERGDFRLTLRAAGSYYLRAERDGRAPGERGPFELTPELGAAALEVAIVPGGAIEGRVLVAAGDSAAGRIVGVSRGDGHAVTARTGADGSFRFERLTPGRWLVRERREEISSSSTTSSMSSSEAPVDLPWSCTVTDGATTRFDLDLTRDAQAVLVGSLLFDGTPVVGWEASLRRVSVDTQAASDHVDSQGQFRLELADPGRYRLRLVGKWGDSPLVFATQEFDVAAGEHAWDLDLAWGRIEGHASSLAGERITYAWSRDDGLNLGCSFTLAADGTFGLPVPAGAGRLERMVDGETELLREVEVQPAGVLRVDLP